jgi:hypothetical protein
LEADHLVGLAVLAAAGPAGISKTDDQSLVERRITSGNNPISQREASRKISLGHPERNLPVIPEHEAHSSSNPCQFNN